MIICSLGGGGNAPWRGQQFHIFPLPNECFLSSLDKNIYINFKEKLFKKKTIIAKGALWGMLPSNPLFFREAKNEKSLRMTDCKKPNDGSPQVWLKIG